MLNRPSKKEIMSKEKEGSKRKNASGRETNEKYFSQCFPAGFHFSEGWLGSDFFFRQPCPDSSAWFFSIKGKEQADKS